MLKNSERTNNWKLWNVWNSRVEECQINQIGFVDMGDFKSLCAHAGNSGTAIIPMGDRRLKRCNVFNCPQGGIK